MANSGIVGALRVLLGLDTAEFDTNIKKVKGQVGGLDTDFKAFGKSFAGAFLPVASVAGAGLALAAFAKTAFDTAGKITDLASQTGLTTDSIQEMQAAASLTGTSLDAFTNAAFKLGVNLATGTDKIRASVEALGLSYETLRAQSPDEQFKAIASALGEVEDVQLRNKLAVELFGKAAKEILPAIAQGYGEIADAAGKTGEAQLEAIDAAGDALTEFWSDFKSLSIEVLGSTILGLKDFFLTLTGAFRQARDEWGAILDVMAGKVSNLPKVAGPAAAAVGQINAPLQDITMSVEDLEKAEKDLDKQVKESIATNLARGAAAKKALEDQATATRNFYNFLGLRRMEDEAAELEHIEDQKKAWREYYNWLGERRMEDEDRTQSFREQFSSAIDLGALLEPFKAAVPEMRVAGRDAGSAFAKGFEGVINNIGSTLARAFEGGGDWMGAVKSLGAQIGQVFSESIAASMKKSMGGGVGAGLAGAGFAGFYSLAFGTAIRDIASIFEENQNRSRAIAQARELGAALLRQYGTVEKLSEALRQVGLDYRTIFLGGVGSVENLTLAMERLRKKIEELNAEKLDLEDQIADTRQELDGLIDDAARLGYIFDRQGNFIRVDFQKMQEVAEEFGVALEALGPAFHAQRLAADAKKIWEAIDLLARGGVDAGTILTGLKDEINKLVNDSIKFGTKIPENMRPWIAELIRTGQLLDANGNKITDISQINFGPPIASEFDIVKNAIVEVIGKLNDLISRLDKLIQLLSTLPQPEAPWASWPDPPVIPDYGEGGAGNPKGPGTGEEVPAMAAGGLVQRPTRALIGEGGQPELVGPVDFMAQALAGAMHSLGGVLLPDLGSLPGLAGAAAGATAEGGAPTIIQNTFAFDVSTLDTDELSRLIRRRVIPEINAQLSNVGDLRSGMRDGLGI